jgi:hypothetical protein
MGQAVWVCGFAGVLYFFWDFGYGYFIFFCWTPGIGSGIIRSSGAYSFVSQEYCP